MDNEELYTNSIKGEILKGRTFDQILNESPSDDCSPEELYAWLDAGEIADKNKKIPNNFRTIKRKVLMLETFLIILITLMVISPFIISNNMFLWLNIPLGVLVAIVSRSNTKLYSMIEKRIEFTELAKHLTIKGYSKRALIKEIIINLLFIPFNLISFGCEILFPPFKK
jgi:hypothetical protein